MENEPYNIVTIIEEGKKYQYGNSILSHEELEVLQEIKKDGFWLFVQSSDENFLELADRIKNSADKGQS